MLLQQCLAGTTPSTQTVCQTWETQDSQLRSISSLATMHLYSEDDQAWLKLLHSLMEYMITVKWFFFIARAMLDSQVFVLYCRWQQFNAYQYSWMKFYFGLCKGYSNTFLELYSSVNGRSLLVKVTTLPHSCRQPIWMTGWLCLFFILHYNYDL